MAMMVTSLVDLYSSHNRPHSLGNPPGIVHFGRSAPPPWHPNACEAALVI
jgi:hypothetical protein